MENKKTPRIVIPNPIGFSIKKEHICSILSGKDDSTRDHVAYFFDTEPECLSEKLLLRYAEVCEVTTNISFSSFQKDIFQKLIKPIASAKRCYSYGDSLATIELSALQGEMIANYLLILYRDKIKNSDLSDDIFADICSKTKERIKSKLNKNNFFDFLNQKHRLKLLCAKGIISDTQFVELSHVHEKRKKYFHHWAHDHYNVDVIALEALKKISNVSSYFIEVLDVDENLKNIEEYLKFLEK